MKIYLLLKKCYTIFCSRPIRKVLAFLNKHGHKKKCYICKREFNSFGLYGKGSKGVPDFIKELKLVGSDIDNYSCIFCGCHDRERHLFMYFDRLQLWDKIAQCKVLHFAPEKYIRKKILSIRPISYIMADLNPMEKSILCIDATNIPYPDKSFDFILCNHVLEHITNYKKAIDEIYRVLNFGGIAILQTPFSRVLENNFEDEGINTNELRLFFYGESDHRRIFSEKQLAGEFISAGFVLKLITNNSLFDKNTSVYYGINYNEDLYMLTK
jgi:predicted SAM-dependent methyltransferase